jgi:Ca-activated chloride channel family protein
MVAARRAAARIVDTLTSRDRFAVLAFDTVV